MIANLFVVLVLWVTRDILLHATVAYSLPSQQQLEFLAALRSCYGTLSVF